VSSCRDLLSRECGCTFGGLTTYPGGPTGLVSTPWLWEKNDLTGIFLTLTHLVELPVSSKPNNYTVSKSTTATTQFPCFLDGKMTNVSSVLGLNRNRSVAKRTQNLRYEDWDQEEDRHIVSDQHKGVEDWTFGMRNCRCRINRNLTIGRFFLIKFMRIFRSSWNILSTTDSAIFLNLLTSS